VTAEPCQDGVAFISDAMPAQPYPFKLPGSDCPLNDSPRPTGQHGGFLNGEKVRELFSERFGFLHRCFKF